MKRLAKIMICVCLCAVLLGALAGCEKSVKEDTSSEEAQIQTETNASKDAAVSGDETTKTGTAEPQEDPIKLRIGSLKGPTTMGLLFLMEANSAGTSKNQYSFEMATAADEILSLMAKGLLDIALVPANVAATYYQKTKGSVAVIDVNTLGVLYLVSSDDSVKGLGDLKGRTIYLTGKGTTPDYVLQYLLQGAGYGEGDVKLEYKSEATEVAAILAQTEGALGFLPQPFVTAAMMQNDKLGIVLSANDAWMETQGENASGLVTGVTIVRKEILEKYPHAVASFLEEHAASAAAINEDPTEGANYCLKEGIVAKEAIAIKAIPYCNVTCLTGEEMKQALQSYLEILCQFNSATVGGKLPEEDFYYLP